MSSSATYTKGQITIAKGAEGICARRINGDISALEIGRTISRLDALSAPCATLPGAHLGKRRNDLGLRQGAHRPGVDLHIDAGGLDQHQRPGVADVAGYGAERPTTRRDGVAVEPPLTAKIDGKAATIVVCHGRRSLPNLLKFAAGGLAERNSAILLDFCGFDCASGTLGAGGNELIAGGFGWELDHVPCVREAEIGFGTVAVVCCVEGFGHFGLLPLISRGAEGKQYASHELNYTHETKERKNFLHLFFAGRGHQAKPSNLEGNRPR